MLCSSGLQMKYRFVRYVNCLARFFYWSASFFITVPLTTKEYRILVPCRYSLACLWVCNDDASGRREKNFKYKKVSLICRWYVPSKHHVWSCQTNCKIFLPGSSQVGELTFDRVLVDSWVGVVFYFSQRRRYYLFFWCKTSSKPIYEFCRPILENSRDPFPSLQI